MPVRRHACSPRVAGYPLLHCFLSTSCCTPHPSQVRDFYNTYLAPSSVTRRKLSVHIAGRAHAAELAAEAPAGVALVAAPQQLGKDLPLWPAMLGDAHTCC